MASGTAASQFETACAEARWADAEAIARTKLTEGPSSEQSWVAGALARCAAARGDRSELRLWLDRMGRISARTPDLTDFQVSILLQAGDLDEAAKLLDRHEEADPAARLISGTARALILVRRGQAEEGRRLIEALLRRHPTMPSSPLRQLADHLGLVRTAGEKGPPIEGIVEIEGDRLTAWAAYRDDPTLPDLRLTDHTGRTLDPPANPSHGPQGQARAGFSLSLTGSGLAHGRITATAGGQSLAGSPVEWTRNPPLARPIRQPPRRKIPVVVTKNPAIDIVIPVYGGRDVTLACLNRVLATIRRDKAGIVVIDDASPDPVLAASLDRLAAEGRITLLRNDVNLGFPASVNRGIALHPKRDVVLLNSDAKVSGTWLRRLIAAAYATHDTGSVTALSNEASICSYGPDTPAAWRAIDRVARRVNAGVTIDLPTAVGFCMYIRRDCLRETGTFSEVLFGRGYGEENDFCLRARALGWRHVAAADVYVGHVGGASFGAARALLQERNLRVLERCHPGYQKLISRFSGADPLAPVRRRMDLGRWKPSPMPVTLLISLDLDGGASRHVEERRQALEQAGQRVLLLTPAPERHEKRETVKRCRLQDFSQPELRDLVFDSEAEIALLADLLRQQPVTMVEIHHSLNHHPAILELPERLGVPHEVVLHDYHWLCPQVSLTRSDGRYCGEPQPSLPHCEACVLEFGSNSGEEITVAALRQRSGRLLTGARRVVAPARDVAERYRRYFPAISPEVVAWDHVQAPHQILSPTSFPVIPAKAGAEGNAQRTIHVAADAALFVDPRVKPGDDERVNTRIAVIGAIGPHKGYEELRACALDAAARDLPLEFVVIGYSSDDAGLFATGRIHVTGRYEEDEAEALIRQQGASCAFISSVCPETWCYALSLAWQAGLQAVAFDLGAPAERIRAQNGGVVLPFGTSPTAINDALLALSTGFVVDGKATLTNHSEQKENPMTQIAATPQEMTLAPGFYAITVIRGGARPRPGRMALPAILISAPIEAGDRVEILASHTTGWLTRQGDTVMLKVTGETSILLTSFKDPLAPQETLDVQVSRVDGSAAAIAPSAPPLPTIEILAHVQRVGDQTYAGSDWAGVPGKGQAIEGFALMVKGGIAPDEIEYKAVTANGWETPWMLSGQFCGTRSQSLPLIGVAVRLKGAAAQRFDALVEAVFVNGGKAGPVRNGSPCRSDVIGAPLDGLKLSFSAKA